LKIESQLLEDHQVRLQVEVESEPMEAAKRRAARAISKKAKIPGFRPGKAPYQIIERFAGAQKIRADALELLLRDLYPKIIEEAGIKPYGPGKLEDISEQDPPVFKMVVPLEATVNLGDYRSIRIPHEPQEVTEEDVDRQLESMRKQHAIIEPVERQAQDGDLVTIKLGAERKNVEEGEVATLIRERSIPILVEPETAGDTGDKAAEWPFPGFSRNLAGLATGDERTITYTFPEDSSFELLRSKEVEYHFVVESVKSYTLPELNDEFALSQGDYENLEALRSQVRKGLETQTHNQYESDYNERILNDLLGRAEMKYPPQMIDSELHTVLHQLENQLAQQKMDMETYLKTRQIDRAALEEEFRPTAEARLKRFLALYEVSQAENIQVPTEELQTVTTQTLQQFSQSMPPEEARKSITPAFVESLTRNIMADLLIGHTQERLRVIAKGELEKTELSAADIPEAPSTEMPADNTPSTPGEATPAPAGEGPAESSQAAAVEENLTADTSLPGEAAAGEPQESDSAQPADSADQST
jgi:trigger factor